MDALNKNALNKNALIKNGLNKNVVYHVATLKMSFIPWHDAMIAPPSLPGCANLVPIKNLDPFNCGMLPTPVDGAPENFAAKCQALKIANADAVPPDCSRLPPEYQPFCHALASNTQIYNPAVWPNTAATPPGRCSSEQLARARERCAAVSTQPREFYSCVWAATKYPAYPEFGVTCPQTLINRDNCPCRMCAPRSPFPRPGPSTHGWVQVGPTPMTCAKQPWGEIQGLNTTPKTWVRRK